MGARERRGLLQAVLKVTAVSGQQRTGRIQRYSYQAHITTRTIRLMTKQERMAKALRKRKDEKPVPITPPGGMPILPGKKKVT